MGNGASKNQPLPFNLSQYEQVPHKNDDEIPVNYKIYRNIHSGVEMQQYQLQFNDEVECRQYYEAFKWRLNEEHIVNTIYFVQNNKNQFCSTAYAGYLYTQRIPIKLSDIKDIPYPDNLYILLVCFQGFSTIYKKTQYFQIQQNLICINNDARIKVWINSDLSKNYPEDIEAQDQKDQRDMVQKIIQLIENNTDQPSQPKSLSEYFSEYQLPTFAQARLLLKQYAKQYKTTIPNKFQSITEYLHGQEQVQQSQGNMQIIDNHKFEQNGRYGQKVEAQNMVYRQKSNQFYNKNQKPQQNHSYIEPHQYHENQNTRFHNPANQQHNPNIIMPPPNRNFSTYSNYPTNNAQPIPGQIIRAPQNQVIFNYQHPPQFNPVQSYTIIRPPLQQYHTINPPQIQYHQQSQPYYHPVIMQNRQYVQINSPKIQGPPQYLNQTYYNNIDNSKPIRIPMINSEKRLNMVNVGRMQQNHIIQNIEQKQMQEQSAISNQQLHKDKSKYKLNEMQDEKVNNRMNSVTNFQNKYNNNRDLDIFNQQFNNKYREVNQFNNVRTNKEQIVRSAKEILQGRQRQARKIQQQKLEIQQQQQQRMDMQSIKPVVYHSIQEYHQLDPEIAQDLLNMNI